MKGLRKIIGLLVLGGLPIILFAQAETRYAYIERFQEIAILEMERAGVPASIKLAQGLLESGAGESRLARKARNHFGMKCGSQWEGDTYYLEDDDYDDKGNLMKSCFRVYDRAEDSYIAHSEFLRDPRKEHRYGFLFRLDPTDYKAWSRGLKRAGYATSPTYAEKLIRIIETYELYQYDQMTLSDLDGDVLADNDDRRRPGEIRDIRQGIRRVNQVKMTTALEGEQLCDVARRTNTHINKIISYNEKLTKPLQNLEKGEYVYLQRKRNNYRGKRKYHIVRGGETMYQIAQLYGLKLRKLYSKNRVPAGSQVAEGEKLKLRGWFKVQDPPRLRSQAAPEEDHEFEWDIVDPDPGADEDPIIIDEEEAEEINEEIAEEIKDTPAYETEYYVVEIGDTLYGIARRYNITVSRLKSINRLESDIISKGQLLRIR